MNNKKMRNKKNVSYSLVHFPCFITVAKTYFDAIIDILKYKDTKTK